MGKSGIGNQRKGILYRLDFEDYADIMKGKQSGKNQKNEGGNYES